MYFIYFLHVPPTLHWVPLGQAYPSLGITAVEDEEQRWEEAALRGACSGDKDIGEGVIILTSTLCYLLVRKSVIHRVSWSSRWKRVESFSEYQTIAIVKDYWHVSCSSINVCIFFNQNRSQLSALHRALLKSDSKPFIWIRCVGAGPTGPALKHISCESFNT